MEEKNELTVQKSPVKFGGRARINKDVLEKLDITKGDTILVRSKSKDILVSLYYDGFMKDKNIKLREEDMKKLGVEEGDKVVIKEHHNLLNKLL